MAAHTDFYSTLGVRPDTEDVVIRAAYRALSQRYHPDRNGGDNADAARRMSEINRAYDVLSDPIKRKEYDALLNEAKAADYRTPSPEKNGKATKVDNSAAMPKADGAAAGAPRSDNPAGRSRNGKSRFEKNIVLAFLLLIAFGLFFVILPNQRKEPVIVLANRGDISSQIAMGRKYLFGSEGVPRDIEKAIPWFNKAAEQGSPEAQFELADIYLSTIYKEEGKIEDGNEETGMDWLIKSANAGYARAQAKLGDRYRYAKPPDFESAILWYRKAAEQGNKRAQSDLGLMYGEGEGVTEDLVQAYAWTSLVTDVGFFDATNPKWIEMQKSYLKRLEERMSNQQFSEAKNLAKRWKNSKE